MSSSEELIRTLYDELRRIARREHRRAGSPATLQTTALISEAYLKLRRDRVWDSERHFLGCAATAMRHILIDAARARMAGKRQADMADFTRALDTAAAAIDDDAEMVALGDALARLAQIDPRLAKVVDCRFFAGLDERRTGEVIGGVTDRTVRRLWIQARAFLYSAMAADGIGGAATADAALAGGSAARAAAAEPPLERDHAG